MKVDAYQTYGFTDKLVDYFLSLLGMCYYNLVFEGMMQEFLLRM